MSRAIGLLKEVVYGILSYAPIILLWRLVPVDGSGSNDQYVGAFRVFLFVAAVHVVVAMWLFRPFDRIAMATDIWLIVCGVLAWAQYWSQLNWFAGFLRGAGVWSVAVPLCLLLAFFSKYGVICAKLGNSNTIRNYSLIIVALMIVVFCWSFYVRRSVVLGVIVPTIMLSILMNRIRKSVEEQEDAT